MFKKVSKAKRGIALALVILAQCYELLLISGTHDYEDGFEDTEAKAVENFSVKANKAIVLFAEHICELCDIVYHRSDSEIKEKCKSDCFGSTHQFKKCGRLFRQKPQTHVAGEFEK